MSPSGAALHCINTTGADRRTANGWMYWKNKASVLINDLYRDAFEHGPGDAGREAQFGWQVFDVAPDACGRRVYGL